MLWFLTNCLYSPKNYNMDSFQWDQFAEDSLIIKLPIPLDSFQWDFTEDCQQNEGRPIHESNGYPSWYIRHSELSPWYPMDILWIFKIAILHYPMDHRVCKHCIVLLITNSSISHPSLSISSHESITANHSSTTINPLLIHPLISWSLMDWILTNGDLPWII